MTILLHVGAAFKATAAHSYEKEVLRVGKWIHPSTGQSVEVSYARLHALASATNKYMRSSDGRLPFPDGHNFDAKKNLGWWTGFRVHGDRLIGTVSVTDEEAARRIDDGSLLGVSAWIEKDVSDTRSNQYPEVMKHVCATPVPVVDGLADFTALSQEASEALYRWERWDAEAIVRRIGGKRR